MMMIDTKLSENFYLSEFVLSPTATRRRINNEPSIYAIANLKTLCERVLQPLREYFDLPIIISSGYRCNLLNQLVGGHPGSQHLQGKAADLMIPGVPLITICKYIEGNLPFDQCILEFNSWVHVSYSQSNRRECLTYGVNGAVYPGIVS